MEQCRAERRFKEEWALTKGYQREDETEVTLKLDKGS